MTNSKRNGHPSAGNTPVPGDPTGDGTGQAVRDLRAGVDESQAATVAVVPPQRNGAEDYRMTGDRNTQIRQRTWSGLFPDVPAAMREAANLASGYQSPTVRVEAVPTEDGRVRMNALVETTVVRDMNDDQS